MANAQCTCGILRLVLRESSKLVVACHCFACQRRTGAPFSVNASMQLILSRFPDRPRSSFTLAKAVATYVCIFVRRAVRQSIGSLMRYPQ